MPRCPARGSQGTSRRLTAFSGAIHIELLRDAQDGHVRAHRGAHRSTHMAPHLIERHMPSAAPMSSSRRSERGHRRVSVQKYL
jgi:hypothetical protein